MLIPKPENKSGRQDSHECLPCTAYVTGHKDPATTPVDNPLFPHLPFPAQCHPSKSEAANMIPSSSLTKLPALARLVGALLLGTGLVATAQTPAVPNLGPNVMVFDPSMPTSQIQAAVDAVANQQVSNQFGTQRYALLFKPGVYGSAATPLIINVGFYTDVAGLGASPTDVTINGHVDVYNQCFPVAAGAPSNCIALDNFWRSVSNLTINVQGLTGCRSSGAFWAVSQAAPMRRINLTGANLTLFDYCTGGPQYASGGYIADSQYQGGTIINGSQQQFFVRNSNIDGWTNGVWNQVFSGVIGAPTQSYPNPTYTTLTSTPVSREKPFLTADTNGKYGVFVPAVQRNLTGTTWASGTTAGEQLPISSFFIASPTTPVEEINLALLFGKNLILTPGVYALKNPIIVERPDTVILGLGLATLVPQTGKAAIEVADVDGVKIAGLIFDAGPVNSPVLLQMGFGLFGLPLPRGGLFSHLHNPSSLNDVYFRIGGATPGKATTSLEVNSADVILDNIWAWRADHGNGVGWTLNTGAHGLVINGDRVTATGLAVEHYQKEQVLWDGNNGETIFYQSELPYDPPSQAAWMDGAANGYPAYVVSNNVNTHQVFGSGIYSFFNQGIPIVEDNAMTVPNRRGVIVTSTGTVFLNGSGQITHVINGVGATANLSNIGQLQPVVQYP